MKNYKKNVFIAIGIILVVLFIFLAWRHYETNYKFTFIGTEESSDGRTKITFQMRGETVRSSHDMLGHPDMTKERVIVERDGEKIKTEDFMIFNWGKPLQENNWKVHFYPAGVEIILMGYGTDSIDVMKESEHIIVYYQGEFRGYSEDEIISEITARYDDQVTYLEEENGKFYFQADGFTFSVTNDFWMTDDYEKSWFGYLAQQFSYGHNRITEFEKSEDENGETIYIPVVGFHGRQPGEVESFSNACCDLVENLQEIVGFDKIGYFSKGPRRYFDIVSYLENYDRTEFYNAVYHRIEQDSLEKWQNDEDRKDGDGTDASSGGSSAEILQEMPAEWRDYEAECSYRKKDGTELRMVGVDRAAGSSFYVLLEAEGGINTSVVNQDPYLGHGGYARWIDFLEDEKIGFSCLSYSGGSLGSLFRTEDGGKSFQEITYPSPEIKLPDGSLYNPFIMPDKIWEEEGKLYMMAGHGPNGDYYENGVWVYGLYESEDMGKNWHYTGTVEG